MIRKTLLAVAALLLLVTPAAAQQSNRTEIEIFMPFVPNIQFAPVYTAIEKGYFADFGMEVTLTYGSEPDGLELLALGEVDYAFVGGEQVIIARANERPVVYVYEWYQRNPVGIVSSQPLTDPAELAGLTVGIPGRFGATYTSFAALLDAVGLTEDDMTVEEIGFNAPEVVCVGGVDAAAVYLNNEPLQIRSRADAGDCGDVTDVSVIPVADYADLVANGIAVSEEKIEDDPQQVRDVIQVFELGLRDTLRNPMESYALSVPSVEGLPYDNEMLIRTWIEENKTFLNTFPSYDEIAARRTQAIDDLLPGLTAEEQAQVKVLAETLPLWEADQLGVTDPASWEVTQEALLRIGFIDEPIDLESAYTNGFLPEEEA